MADKKYDSIINLPHHVSKVHPPLSTDSYAAQFSPFAALTGYDDIVFETARYTEERAEGSESLSAELDKKLSAVLAELNDGKNPGISVKYFKKDAAKSGGAYLTYNGAVKKVDFPKRRIVFTDGTVISADDIVDISGKSAGEP